MATANDALVDQSIVLQRVVNMWLVQYVMDFVFAVISKYVSF